jgi:S-adenosyl-L-methionine hydrolase (adenosine-forming)
MGVIALITDFGHNDWFAGEMKGAMLCIAPGTTFIDITNDIAPGDIRAAAFTLLACYRTFPAGTVFCAVVDPGVGGIRVPIAVKNENHFFVGPDNGVLSWVIKKERTSQVRKIENTSLISKQVSNTFHGRDIFGPVSAHLSQNIDFDAIGSLHPDFLKLPWPKPVSEKSYLVGIVIHIDRFGNAITTVDNDALSSLDNTPTKVNLVKHGTELPLRNSFQEVPTGQGLAYIGSAGYLEIAINNANAATIFGLHIGDKVEVT